ncbi:MAG: hypothetical protein ACOX81_03730 [Candidatus Heteroscillospira sp.]|jgi:hypothetical protein
MSDYITSLALSYFREKREKYLISELMEILGYNRNQIDALIMHLMQEEFLRYEDDLLRLSTKGISYLIANDQAGVSIKVDEINRPHINPQNVLALDAPYVPVGFTKKYKG